MQYILTAFYFYRQNNSEIDFNGCNIADTEIQPDFRYTHSVDNDKPNEVIIIASYQIHSIAYEVTIYETEIEIPRRDSIIAEGCSDALQFPGFDKPFMLHTSVSATLCETVIANKLIKLIIPASSNGIEIQCHIQPLDCIETFCNRIFTLHQLPTKNRLYNREGETIFGAFHKLSVSPSGEFLFMLQLEAHPDGQVWSMDVFQDPSYRNHPAKPQLAGLLITISNKRLLSITPLGLGQTDLSMRSPLSLKNLSPFKSEILNSHGSS